MHVVKIENLNCQTSNKANYVDNPLPRPWVTYCVDTKKEWTPFESHSHFFLIGSSNNS